MIIGLTGKKRAGKSTAAKHLVEKHGFIELSFAKALKDMALAVDPIVGVIHCQQGAEAERLSEVVHWHGWEVAKDLYPEVRRFLQRLGTEGVRGTFGPNMWVDLVDDQIEEVMDKYVWSSVKPNVVIADVRFENEAELIRNWGGEIIEVVLDKQPDGDADNHASEAGVEYDIQIDNVYGKPEEMLRKLDMHLQLMGVG